MAVVVRRTKIKTRLETAYGEWIECIPACTKGDTCMRLHLRSHPAFVL